MDEFFAQRTLGALLEALGPLDNDINAPQLTVVRILIECIHAHMKEPAMTENLAACLPSLMHMTTKLLYTTTHAMQLMRETDKADVSALVRAHIGLLALLEALHLSAMHAQETAFVSMHLVQDMRTSTMIDALVELLRQARAFMPPKPPFAPAQSSASKTPVPDQYVPSALHTNMPNDDRPGLPYLKRTALQLMGTLAFHAPGTPWADVHAFQNRIRETGGLYEVLSLTALDELNPCTYPYAVYTYTQIQVFTCLHLHNTRRYSRACHLRTPQFA